MKMKNIVILMMAIITFAQGLYAEQSYSAETRREVAIKVVVIGSDIPRPRPRSLRPIITAALEENQALDRLLRTSRRRYHRCEKFLRADRMRVHLRH